MPTFFLSSAVGDDDPYVAAFHAHLCHRLGDLSSDFSAEDGYLGTAGTDLRAWPEAMAHALGRADVFVALYSRRYFLSEACGRQWAVFAQRLAWHEQQSGARCPALIALPWSLDVGTDDVPAGLAALLPDRPQRGLRQLVRLHSLRDAYANLVDDVAQQIIALSRTYTIPRYESLPEFQDTPNAFDRNAAGGDGPPSGVPHLHIVVAAASRPEMDDIRSDLTYYGSTPEEWAPYLPAVSDPIANRARSIAANQFLASEVAPIDGVVERFERARRDGQIVVILVDSWVTRLDGYRRLLMEIDRRGLRDTAILVPANAADAETDENRDDLSFGIRRAFANTLASTDAMVRTEISTPDRFDAELAAVIEEFRNRIFREGQVRHLPAGAGRAGERPLLTGP